MEWRQGRSGVPGGLPAAGWLRGEDARDVFAPGLTRPEAEARGIGSSLDPFRHP